MKKLFTNLTFWVITAIAAGAILGYIDPGTAVKMQILGKWFVKIITWFIYPIIFLTITLGISGMSSLKKVGKVGGKAIIYFEIVTTLALIIGLVVVNIIKPGNGVSLSAIEKGDITQYTKQAQVFSWWQFFKDNLTIQVLIAAILFGIFLSKYNNRQKIIEPLSLISKYVFKALHFVMVLAPIGAFGGMAYTIGKYGLHTLLPLGKLMLTVYITCGVFIFVVLHFILRYYKVSLWSFLKYIKAELLIVFGTSSSESALPSLMEKLERMGCSKPVVGLVVPAGYSFNLDGTTIYLSMATVFLAQVYNVNLTFAQEMTILGILFITSKGAAGVTGSGFITLASTLTVVKVIPVEGLMSEARAITNFIGNGVATIFLANNEKEFDRKKMKEAFNSPEKIEI